MPAYRAVFFDTAAEFVFALPRRRQIQVMAAIGKIARHPFLSGDFVTTDTEERKIEHLLIETFVVSYWIDHAACLVMITEIELTD